HHRVPRQRIVMLPASQLTNATDLGVNGAQAGAVALTPDHALVVSGRDLAPSLHQRAVGIEEKLGIIQRAAVTLVDTDGNDYPRLLGSFPDGVGGRRRHRHGLAEQLALFGSGDVL